MKFNISEKTKNIGEWWSNAKFDLAIKAIFVFAVIVSFSHTRELYSSVGFDVPIEWLNNLIGVNLFDLALFATLAAEAAFAVGLWGLYDAYEQIRRFPNIKEYWQVWALFGSGLLIVGWSNIGGTVGYNFLIGQPWKGILLGLSIPAFVLGSVLVNFMRKSGESHNVSQTDSHTLTHEDSHSDSQTESHNSHTLTHTESHEVSHAASHTNDSHTHTGSHTDSHTHSHEDSHEAAHAQSEEVSHTDSHTQNILTLSHTREDSRVRESHIQDESHTQYSHNKDSHTRSHKKAREESHEESHEKRDLREVAREVARDYYRKHKKLPTIRGLMAEAGCKEWDARIARNDVKKELGIVEEKPQKKQVAN